MERITRICVRTSPEEKRLFEKTAKAQGLSVSAWVRLHMLAEVRRQQREKK
jgi:uncharacterized protein (DUF1778 family)